jgi:hypothetical protein
VKEANASLGRARLEAELRTTLSRAAMPLRQCDRPMLPKGLGWLKGQVAWAADVPLRKVRGRSSSAARFLGLLADEPRRVLSRNATVTVYTHRTRFVLVAPFADARVRIGGHPGLRLHTVAADGPWRVLVPANTPGCSMPQARLSRASSSASPL